MGTFAIISLIFSVLGMAISASMQNQANKENIQAAQDINEQQINYSRESAETANQQTIENYWSLYSPQSKVQQYKDAGLSPGLMYSMGGVSGTGQAAAQGLQPNLSIPTINPLINGNAMNDLSNIFKNAQENDKTEKEGKKIVHDTNLIDKTIEEKDAVIKKYEAETNNTKVSTANLELKNKLIDNEVKISNATLDDAIEIVKKNKELVQKNIDKAQHEINILSIEESKKSEFLDAEIAKMHAESWKYSCEALLAKAEAKLAKAKETLTYAETNKTRSETNLNITKRQQLMQEIEKNEIELGKLREHRWIADSDGGVDKVINFAIEIGETFGGFLDEWDEWSEKNVQKTKDWIKNHYVGDPATGGFFMP